MKSQKVSNLGKFLALPTDSKRLVLLAAFWLPLTHFRLRRFGLVSCLGSLGVANIEDVPSQEFDPGQYAQAQECERSVALASRHGLVAGTCLSRSLTLMRLLARRGIAGRLRVGVKLGNGALDAHAWVEVAGVPLGQGELDYAVFPPL